MKKSSIIVFVLLFVVFGFYSYSWVRYGKYFYKLDKNDPSNVVTMFALSMMQHEENIVKSLIVQEQLPYVESSFESRQSVNCPIPLFDGDNLLLGGLNGSYGQESNTYIFESSIVRLPCPDTTYVFSIKDIVLQKTEHGWQISSFGHVCEAWGYEKNDCFP